jgi:hypothetical protein
MNGRLGQVIDAWAPKKAGLAAKFIFALHIATVQPKSLAVRGIHETLTLCELEEK